MINFNLFIIDQTFTESPAGGEIFGFTRLRVFGFGNSAKKCHVFCCLPEIFGKVGWVEYEVVQLGRLDGGWLVMRS